MSDSKNQKQISELMKKSSKKIIFGSNTLDFVKERKNYRRYGNTSKCTYQIPDTIITDIISITTYAINRFDNYKLLPSFEALVFQKLMDFLFDYDKSNLKIKTNICRDFVKSLKAYKITKNEIILPVFNLDKKKFKPYKKVNFFEDNKKLESIYGNDEITKIFIGTHSGCYLGIEFESFEDTTIHDLGTQQISRFINCLNLLDTKNHISLYDNKISLKQTYTIICKNKKITDYEVHTNMPKNHFTLDTENHTWNNLCDAVLSFAPNQTQQRIISALYWYSKINEINSDVYEKILFIVMALERLLFLDGELSKTKLFTRRIMHLYPNWNFENPQNFWTECYQIRNNIIHKDEQFIDESKVIGLYSVFFNLFVKFVDKSKTYPTDNVLKKHFKF